MSTRGRIGKLNSDGSVVSIYVHHDSYVGGVGLTLLDYYNKYNIDMLLLLGDLSSLGAEPTSDPKAWKIQHARDNCCMAYKDRGEDCPARKHDSEEAYYDFCGECGDIEYAYLLKDDGWHFRDCGDFGIDKLLVEHLDE